MAHFFKKERSVNEKIIVLDLGIGSFGRIVLKRVFSFKI